METAESIPCILHIDTHAPETRRKFRPRARRIFLFWIILATIPYVITYTTRVELLTSVYMFPLWGLILVTYRLYFDSPWQITISSAGLSYTKNYIAQSLNWDAIDKIVYRSNSIGLKSGTFLIDLNSWQLPKDEWIALRVAIQDQLKSRFNFDIESDWQLFRRNPWPHLMLLAGGILLLYFQRHNLPQVSVGWNKLIWLAALFVWLGFLFYFTVRTEKRHWLARLN